MRTRFYMEYIQEFFEFVNVECLNFHIIIPPGEDQVHVEWKKISETAYTHPDYERINLRVQKNIRKKNNFLDCVHYQTSGNVQWHGFPFVSCTRYEATTSQTNSNRLDSTFHFDNQHQLHLKNITTKTMILLLDFFNDFLT